jgi:hypothetical protein
MSNLDPLADEAVRTAVEAFVAGAFVPAYRGVTVFETKNSRYRLLDGVVIAAPDDSLVGAELVGWLIESQPGGVVYTAWQSGARAVLVDRRRARNIVVTSSTRLRDEDERTPAPRREPRYVPSPPASPMSARLAPILNATPGPLPVAVPVPPASSSEPSQPRAAVHAPPRPISRPSAPHIEPLPPLPRPLPPPVAPPRRPPPPDDMAASSALPLVTRIAIPPTHPGPPAVPYADPASEPGWEVTSAELEIAEDLGAPTRKREQHDTLEDIPAHEGPDSTNASPFLLTRQAPSVPPPPHPGHDEVPRIPGR